jgi:hypothetical protein
MTFFTLLPYNAAQSERTAGSSQPAAEDGGRWPMGGHVGQASGGPNAGAAEDMEDGSHEARAEARKTSTRAGGRRWLRGEMGARAGRGRGGPPAAADLPI